MAVFFNFFSEAEPFAAILIARGTHGFREQSKLLQRVPLH